MAHVVWGGALENLPFFYTRKRDATTDTSDTTDTNNTTDTNLLGNILRLIGIRPIEWIVDAISAIIKQLKWASKMMLIIRSFFHSNNFAVSASIVTFRRSAG